MRHKNKTDLRKVYELEVVESQPRTKQHGDIYQKEGKCKIFSVNLGRHGIVHIVVD